MIRQEARRAVFTAGEARAGEGEGPLRQKGARLVATLLRLLLAPLVALAAALSGALFVLLLPICGIASIAEGIARASWRQLRRVVAARERH